MTKLTHTIEIQRPVGEVYDLARRVEKYPEFLPGYKESRIVKQQERGALLERAALVRGELVRWKSWVSWKENEAIHFRHQEGPLEGMWVNWRFVPLTPESTRLTITHRFEVPRPFGLRRILEKWVFKPRINEMAKQVIEAFKVACEQRAVIPI